MSAKRGGLGRGLGSLFPPAVAVSPTGEAGHAPDASVAEAGAGADATAPPVPAQTEVADRGSDTPTRSAEVGGAWFADLPLACIAANPRQPRQVFDEDAMAELVHSIREVGLLQPVVVRPVGEASYELVMGERRWRACREAGLETIPAIVRSTEDSDLLRDALLENLHRSQLNPLEEAAAYDQMLADFGCTHDELAARIGKSRPTISNTIRLLRLPVPVQRRVAAGVLSAGHARALLGLEEPGAQERLAGRIVAEGLSVRAVEEIVAVGEPGSAPRAARRRPEPLPELAGIADRLSDRLDTRVKVDLGRTKGKITIEFAGVEDLERIVEALAPERP